MSFDEQNADLKTSQRNQEMGNNAFSQANQYRMQPIQFHILNKKQTHKEKYLLQYQPLGWTEISQNEIAKTGSGPTITRGYHNPWNEIKNNFEKLQGGQ